MDRKEALSIVYNCAKIYSKNLQDYNIMFVIENKKSAASNTSIEFIETIYYSHNFLHLTGMEYNSKNRSIKSKYQLATEFYYNLLNGKVSYKDINYKNPFTTQLKLDILNQLGNIEKSAKFLGNYNNTIKDMLYTEKVVGNISYCFGFVRDSRTKYFYLPNTTIKENIKNITDDTCNIVAILKKEKSKHFYSRITYIKNGIDLNCLTLNKNLINLIDFGHLEFGNKNDIKNTERVNLFREKLILGT